MCIIMRSLLAIFVAVCTLPSAFAGGLQCQSCLENPLQSPEQCNMSSTEKNCSSAICIALTAELTNGTFVGMRGCYLSGAGNCTNTSACNERNQTLPGPVYFARCVAECCTEARCNKNLFPMLSEMTRPSSTVKDMAVSSTAGPNATQPRTTPTPTSAGIKTKAFFYLPFFLLVIFDIS